MIDADLAKIYGYSTKSFNRQVKNNIERFPEEFRFQLNSSEAENLRCKNCTSSWGGLRYAPFAFTEQGIYMLMTVLKGDLAARQSMALIRLFKQMKDYIIAENRLLLGTDAIAQIALQTAQNDNYLDVKTLDLLRAVAKNVSIRFFSGQYGRKVLTESMLADFRAARPDVLLKGPKEAGHIFHDRYILLDFGLKNEKVFHCGASSKDAGGKITTIMQLENFSIYRAVFAGLLNKS